MSLTSFVNEPDVRRGLRLAIPKPQYKFNLPLLAPPLTKCYGLVGTAFDYLLRFYLEWLNPGVKTSRWVAVNGLEILSESVSKRSRLYKLAQKAYDQAERNYLAYIRDGELTDDLITGVIHLSHLDVIFRAGPEYLTEDDLKRVDELVVKDLRALLSLVKAQDFMHRGGICVLNPAFGDASRLVGGADADIIIDNRLIDIKTIKNIELSREHFNQLLGYYILLTLEGMADYEEITEIEYLCVYFARYGYLHQMPIADFIDPQRFSRLVKWFVEMACPLDKVRISYYRNFSWPPCREWLLELQEKRRQERVATLERQLAKKARMEAKHY